MTISMEDVKRVAGLARLDLRDEELLRMGGELDRILEYMEMLGENDTHAVEPMAHPLGILNVMRDDCPTPACRCESALADTPQAGDGSIVVPAVLE